MWPARLIFELRNLVDESRTHCWLEERVDPVAGIVLKSNGKDCVEGRWSDRNLSASVNEAENCAGAKWLWKEVAEIGFDTGSRVLEVNQTWGCGANEDGKSVKARGEVRMALEMECRENREEYWLAPVSCRPARMTGVSSVGGPLLLGPGKAVVLGS